jgi:hypothetical protein
MLETARYVVVSCKLHYATDATTVERCVQYYLILYIKWNLVVRGSWSSFFMYLQDCTCSTDTF